MSDAAFRARMLAEFERRDFEQWLAEKEEQAKAQLSAPELAQAEKMGMSPIEYLRQKPAHRLEGAELRAAQEAMAERLGVSLNPDARPIASFSSKVMLEAWAATASRAGKLTEFYSALAENDALAGQGKPMTARVPREVVDLWEREHDASEG